MRFFWFLVACVVASLQCPIALANERAGDTWLRRQSLQLHNDAKTCSAQQVVAPSGKSYVISAAHCEDVARDKSGVLVDIDGKEYKSVIVGVDPNTDLLLLRGIPSRPSIRVAKISFKGDHVRAFTRGAGKSPFKTEGYLVQEEVDTFPMFPITGVKQFRECADQGLLMVPGPLGTMVCIRESTALVTTVPIIPGSSGGMLVNDKGELVGIASAIDTTHPFFSYFVRLPDIKNFLSRY